MESEPINDTNWDGSKKEVIKNENGEVKKKIITYTNKQSISFVIYQIL